MSRAASAPESSSPRLAQIERALGVPLRIKASRGQSLRLVVREAAIDLMLPRNSSLADAESFALLQLGWMRKHLAAQQSLQQRGEQHCQLNGLAADGGDFLPVFGARRALRYRHQGAPYLLQDERLELLVSQHATPAAVRKQLLNALLALLQQAVAQDIKQTAAVLGVQPRKVTFKAMRGRWGSLGPSNSMNLNVALVFAPRAALRYVVVHELAHVLERNHSGAFWAQVRRAMPEFESSHRWLQKHHAYLMQLLDQLLTPGAANVHNESQDEANAHAELGELEP